MKPTAAKQIVALAILAALAVPLAASAARPPHDGPPGGSPEYRHCRPPHPRPQTTVTFCAPCPPPAPTWYWGCPPPPPPPPPVWYYPCRPGFNIVFSF